MTLPETTAPVPARASAYRGLHLVPSGPNAVASSSSDLSNPVLYRVVAVGAALFLVVTLF